jgi:hypothetical protein
VRSIAPNSGMAKALSHALKRWPSLVVYAQSGDISIDNNPVENCIRPNERFFHALVAFPLTFTAKGETPNQDSNTKDVL